jgi:hypothetical protein
MASGGLPGPCCLAGFVAKGEPKGEVTKLGGVDTYVAKPGVGEGAVPPVPGKAIVLITGKIAREP